MPATGTTARIRPATIRRWRRARAAGSRSRPGPSSSGVLQDHSTVGFGGGQLAALALLAGPLGDHLGGVPLPHLALVRAQRGQPYVQPLPDLHVGVGPLRAVDEKLAQLV